MKCAASLQHQPTCHGPHGHGMKKEIAWRDSGDEDEREALGLWECWIWGLDSVPTEDGLVLDLVEAGEGLNYLTELGLFHGGVWYLLPPFGTTVESCVCVFVCVKEYRGDRRIYL